MPVDRDTPLLLPPSIQEWVPQDDMSRFIVDAAGLLEERSCGYNWRGSGSEQYPPRRMPALRIYCCANRLNLTDHDAKLLPTTCHCCTASPEAASVPQPPETASITASHATQRLRIVPRVIRWSPCARRRAQPGGPGGFSKSHSPPSEKGSREIPVRQPAQSADVVESSEAFARAPQTVMDRRYNASP